MNAGRSCPAVVLVSRYDVTTLAASRAVAQATLAVADLLPPAPENLVAGSRVDRALPAPPGESVVRPRTAGSCPRRGTGSPGGLPDRRRTGNPAAHGRTTRTTGSPYCVARPACRLRFPGRRRRGRDPARCGRELDPVVRRAVGSCSPWAGRAGSELPADCAAREQRLWEAPGPSSTVRCDRNLRGRSSPMQRSGCCCRIGTSPAGFPGRVRRRGRAVLRSSDPCRAWSAGLFEQSRSSGAVERPEVSGSRPGNDAALRRVICSSSGPGEFLDLSDRHVVVGRLIGTARPGTAGARTGERLVREAMMETLTTTVPAGHRTRWIGWRAVWPGLAWSGLLAALHGEITQLRYFSQVTDPDRRARRDRLVLTCAVTHPTGHRCWLVPRASTTYAIVTAVIYKSCSAATWTRRPACSSTPWARAGRHRLGGLRARQACGSAGGRR